MIKGIIIVNNHGNPRLAKFYQTVEGEAAQQQVIRSIFQQVSTRPDSFCNYLEGQTVPYWGSDVKLIYRHYATLYFVFAVDSQESDLGILDLIQVFVECLDKVGMENAPPSNPTLLALTVFAALLLLLRHICSALKMSASSILYSDIRN
jgi:hypothetical protein